MMVKMSKKRDVNNITTITVDKGIWRKVTELRLSMNKRRLDEVIEELIEYYESKNRATE